MRALLGSVLAAGFGTAAYFLASNWPAWFPRAEFEAAAPTECNLATGPCTARFGATGAIRLAMSPQPLRAAAPMQLAINAEGIGARRVLVDFTGADMNMGLTRVELSERGSGHFAGEATLPVCVSRRMTWRARVSASAADGVYYAEFLFDTVRY